MATVLSHAHFCPACDELWKCVQWFCAQEDCDDLLCKACDQMESEVGVVDRRCVIAELAGSDLAASLRAQLHPSIFEIGKRLAPGLSGDHLISLKEPQGVGLTAGSVDQFPH